MLTRYVIRMKFYLFYCKRFNNSCVKIISIYTNFRLDKYIVFWKFTAEIFNSYLTYRNFLSKHSTVFNSSHVHDKHLPKEIENTTASEKASYATEYFRGLWVTLTNWFNNLAFIKVQRASGFFIRQWGKYEKGK